MLRTSANGFGGVALLAMLIQEGVAAVDGGPDRSMSPLSPAAPHFPPRAKNVIFLYMDGGPSQVDTFDPKPLLNKYNGEDPGKFFKVEPTQFNRNGTIFGSPWGFRQYGQSGTWVSDLFPHLARHVDDLCVIRSMVSESPSHTNANFFLHTGLTRSGRPSAGAWVSYGLGSENQNLPSFVVLNGGLIPSGSVACFSNGFLPAAYQGSIFRPEGQPVANIQPSESDARLQQNKISLVRKLDRGVLDQLGGLDQVESAVTNYELAFRMQSAVPELMDLGSETEATQRLYGLESDFEPTRTFGRECLIARRLVERGVRFVELTCPFTPGVDRWDQHKRLRRDHAHNARAIDQPTAALLADLKKRGMLNETLVIWAGEFGRTPFAQGNDGRDHHPYCFTIWMAGGGIRGGYTYGETDEFGYRLVRGRMEIYDLHATMLHLLGLDHERLTFRFSSRDMRLTDVHGHVVRDLLA